MAKRITEFYRLKGFESGIYGDEYGDQMKSWSKQLGIYVLALVTMKVVVLALFGLCPWLERLGEWVLEWTMGNYRIQVVFVMLMYVDSILIIYSSLIFLYVNIIDSL